MKEISFSTLILSLVVMFPTQNLKADEDNSLARFINEHHAALVTVKYVLTINMGNLGGNKEMDSENELTCSMISAKGLVVCSNNQLSGFLGLMKQFSKSSGDEMSATPRDIKVLVDGQNESFDAAIVARDTELDMIWLQVVNTGLKPFSFIDFSDHAETGIDEPILIIRRMASSFGRAPVISRSRIGGMTSKPRKLYVPGNAMMNGAGLAVFAEDGRPVGLVVTQLPEVGENTNSFSNMTGSGMANLQDAMSGMILPASDVALATRRALETMESQQ